MFGYPFHIRYLDNFSNSLILLESSFMITFRMAYLSFLYFCDLTLVLKARAVTNPFSDLPNFPFDSEDVVFILFRLSNFSEIFKVTHFSLPLISLCFLTFSTTAIFHVCRLKQILLTCELFLPERLPSEAAMINRR